MVAISINAKKPQLILQKIVIVLGNIQINAFNVSLDISENDLNTFVKRCYISQ